MSNNHLKKEDTVVWLLRFRAFLCILSVIVLLVSITSTESSTQISPIRQQQQKQSRQLVSSSNATTTSTTTTNHNDDASKQLQQQQQKDDTDHNDTDDQRIICYVVGDEPYTRPQAERLHDHMIQLPDDGEFVIHVGDVHNSNECVEDVYKRAEKALRVSPVPVFVLLGDNDWNDCPHPESAYKYWYNLFYKFDEKYWMNHTFTKTTTTTPIERYMDTNFAFIRKNTLFIGLNLVGGTILDESVWNDRLENQINWTITVIRSYVVSTLDNGNTTSSSSSNNSNGRRVVLFGHSGWNVQNTPFFYPLYNFIQSELQQSNIPLLYIHGDVHKWQYTTNYMNQSLALRVSVTGMGREKPLRVVIHPPPLVSSSSDHIMQQHLLPTQQAFGFQRRFL